MSTNQRKDKRAKAQRTAFKDLAELRREKAVVDAELERAQDELDGLRPLPQELRDAFVTVGHYKRAGEALTKTNIRLQQELDALDGALNSRYATITKLQNELAELKKADTDSAKLRRRLRTRTEEINRLRAELRRS